MKASAALKLQVDQIIRRIISESPDMKGSTLAQFVDALGDVSMYLGTSSEVVRAVDGGREA